jgi:hypothetical protein
VSLADADYECVHGRLRGDPCPQPATVPGPNDKPVPNPSRLWAKPYPCDCWGESRVRSTTPDPFAAALTRPIPTPTPIPGRDKRQLPTPSLLGLPAPAAEAGTTEPAVAG